MARTHVYKDRVPTRSERLVNTLIFGAVAIAIAAFSKRMFMSPPPPLKPRRPS